MRSIGFDLDMTLVDSADGIVASVQYVVAQYGVEADGGEIRSTIGLPLDHVFPRWLPDEPYDVLLAAYRAHYREHGIPLTRAMPGAAEAIATVRERGDRVLVVTAKYGAVADLALQAAGLDADEVVLPDLREEILAVSSGGRGDVAGCWINRYFVFLGKRIHHCGYYPSWNLRLFRRGRARYEDREVHEHMVVEGSTIRLRGHLEHHDRRGLEAYMAKHNRYSTLEAQEIVRLRRMTDAERRSLPRIGGPLAARRWFKERVYPRLPARWAFRFLHMYLLRLGILDGLTGLRFCLFISAYELLIDLKVVEFEREASRPR